MEARDGLLELVFGYSMVNGLDDRSILLCLHNPLN